MFFVVFPSSAFAISETTSTCYISTVACPAEYAEYAGENAMTFVRSLNNLNFNSIYIGSPFAFTNADDVYYFPIVCDGAIKYLFRVYEAAGSLYGVISEFLAADLENLADSTSVETPMYLSLIGTQIIATIGAEQYVLFEYPANALFADHDAEFISSNSRSVINIKNSYNIELNLRQTRDVFEFIDLDIRETQSDDAWCVAYCLATVIRTQTDYEVTAESLMAMAVPNYTIYSAFPWNNGAEKITEVSGYFGLSPTVLVHQTASIGVMAQEIIAGRPCIMGMRATSGGGHAIVLCGWSSLGTWTIWNPWFNGYESYSISAPYVTTGLNGTTYYFTEESHAYNFG